VRAGNIEDARQKGCPAPLTQPPAGTKPVAESVTSPISEVVQADIDARRSSCRKATRVLPDPGFRVEVRVAVRVLMGVTGDRSVRAGISGKGRGGSIAVTPACPAPTSENT